MPLSIGKFEGKSIKDCVIHFLSDRQEIMAEEKRTNKKVNVEELERKMLGRRRGAVSNRKQRDRNETMEKIFAKQNPVRTVIFFLSLNHNADVFMPRVFLEPFYRQTMVFGD